MTSQQFYVSRSRALKLPNLNVKTVADPRTGRRTRVGESGGFLKPGSPLPSELVDWAKNKKESNGQSCLQNWIESGFVVLEAGASSPLDVAPVFGPERFIDPANARRSGS